MAAILFIMGEGSDNGSAVRSPALGRYASCGGSAVFCASLIMRVMPRTESTFSSQRLPSRVQARNDLTPASWAACRSSAQASSKSASWAGVNGGRSASTGGATGKEPAAAGVPRRPKKSRSRKAISPLSKPGSRSRLAQGFPRWQYPAGLVPL